MRDGRRFRLTIPAEGEVELLRTRAPEGGSPLPGTVEGSSIVHEWGWPWSRAPHLTWVLAVLIGAPRQKEPDRQRKEHR